MGEPSEKDGSFSVPAEQPTRHFTDAEVRRNYEYILTSTNLYPPELHSAVRSVLSEPPLNPDWSDKSYPFFHEGKTDLLIVTEAPIDLMSHASIAADFYGRDWMQDHRISTGCLWNGAIDRYLEGHPQIKRLVFAVDNDYLARDKNGQLRNWGQLTAAKWMKAYTEKGYACAVHVPHLNDFNTDLVEMRKGRSVEDLDRQRMAELETAFEQSAEEESEQGMEV